MSETYAKKVWQDRAGEVYDTEGEAFAASRAHKIGEGMRREHLNGGAASSNNYATVASGLTWFLGDPEQIISDYNHVCLKVDEEMSQD